MSPFLYTDYMTVMKLLGKGNNMYEQAKKNIQENIEALTRHLMWRDTETKLLETRVKELFIKSQLSLIDSEIDRLHKLLGEMGYTEEYHQGFEDGYNQCVADQIDHLLSEKKKIEGLLDNK